MFLVSGSGTAERALTPANLCPHKPCNLLRGPSFATVSEEEKKEEENKQTKGDSQGEAGSWQSHGNKRLQLSTCKLGHSVKLLAVCPIGGSGCGEVTWEGCPSSL